MSRKCFGASARYCSTFHCSNTSNEHQLSCKNYMINVNSLRKRTFLWDVSGVQVLPTDAAKMPWLQHRLPEFIDAGDVLVFANQKARVDEITRTLQAAGIK